jgi:short-subunit dehydrogenase
VSGGSTDYNFSRQGHHMDIEGRVVIVTGASSGIGLATARHLASLGAMVVLAARSGRKLEALGKELPGSLAVATDMRREKDVEGLVEKAMAKYGRIDILVNNAGQGILGNVESLDLAGFRKVMELNLFAVVRAMQLVIPIMRKQGGGVIVNVSSQVTRTHIPGLAGYSATKYALNSISLTAREELERDNIKVCMVLPTGTDTDFMKNSLGSSPYWEKEGRMGGDPPEKVARRIAELINTEKEELSV